QLIVEVHDLPACLAYAPKLHANPSSSLAPLRHSPFYLGRGLRPFGLRSKRRGNIDTPPLGAVFRQEPPPIWAPAAGAATQLARLRDGRKTAPSEHASRAAVDDRPTPTE